MEMTISTWKDMTEEIQTKIIRKRPVCDAKSGKRKLFPLSLLWGGFDYIGTFKFFENPYGLKKHMYNNWKCWNLTIFVEI